LKKYFKKLAYFQLTIAQSSTDHDSPRIHHNLTTKTPHKNGTFSKITLKNTRKSTKKAPATAGTFSHKIKI